MRKHVLCYYAKTRYDTSQVALGDYPLIWARCGNIQCYLANTRREPREDVACDHPLIGGRHLR